MIRSMTAYSAARAEETDFSLSVSVKSTNHRNLDLQLRLPACLDAVDALLRRLVKDRVTRGHIELTVVLDRAGATTIQFDRRLLDAYLAAYSEVRKELRLASEPDVMELLQAPGMIVPGNGAIEPGEMERIQTALNQVTTLALCQLNEMRTEEGKALYRDFRARLARLEELTSGIEKLSSGISRLYQRRLEARLRDLLPQESPGIARPDPARLAQEVAYLASRSDIAEELTRFRSHIDQVLALLDAQNDVGKKLDFLLQEMNREANTLLSKTTDVPEVGLEIGRQAIELKTEIEKIREQAQNIE